MRSFIILYPVKKNSFNRKNNLNARRREKGKKKVLVEKHVRKKIVQKKNTKQILLVVVDGPVAAEAAQRLHLRACVRACIFGQHFLSGGKSRKGASSLLEFTKRKPELE
jgi:hypothetical protein